MSDTPSPVASSAAQANFQAKTSSDVREARKAGQSHAANAQARTVTEEGTTVETTDTDAAVFTNSEGAGSQGRNLDQQKESGDSDANSGDDPDGITRDPDGNPHIDVQI